MLHVSSRASALACALAAFSSSVPGVPDQTFEKVCATGPEDLIDFVEVVEEGQEKVRLVVYHDRRTRKLEWDTEGSTKDSPVGLESGSELLVSEGGRVLGFHALTSRTIDQKPELKALPGTELHFFKGAGGEIEPPPTLRGARGVQASEGAGALFFTRRAREFGGPAEVSIFGRTDNKFVERRSFEIESAGRMQISRDGRLVVYEEGDKLRLRDGDGAPLGEVPAGVGFWLGRDREVLAVRSAEGLRFVPLEPERGAPLAESPPIDFKEPALGVVVAGPYALAFTPTRLFWIEWKTRSPIWEQRAPAGRYSSVDAFIGPQGNVLLAVGRLDVLRPAGLHEGRFQWGEATAIAEVLNGDGQLVASTSFKTSRWKHDAPYVRVLPKSRRVLVRTGDSVLLSAPTP